MKSVATLTSMISISGISAGIAKPEVVGAIRELDQLRNWRCIAPLLHLFDDAIPLDDGEELFEIIRLVESFPSKEYVREIVAGADRLIKLSPIWASFLFMRILNSDEHRHRLVVEVRNANASARQAISWLMDKINAESVEFIPVTFAVSFAATTPREQ